MANKNVLIIGVGHLAYRLKKLAEQNGCTVNHLTTDLFINQDMSLPAFDRTAKALANANLEKQDMVYLVDDKDEHNLELMIVLISMHEHLPITASFFNENIAPHLKAAHPNLNLLNPAKIAASAFVAALNKPVQRTLSHKPVQHKPLPKSTGTDNVIALLIASFAIVVAASTIFFHFAEGLSWLNALYFVIVTVATVGYGDFNLMNASAASKLVDILLILASTVFIWLIFSLTIDRIIKKRAQLALGRKKYTLKNHIIICGLGRLGYFIAEQLLDQGEKVVIIEQREDLPAIEYFRNRKADVYIGNAQLASVLQDVNVVQAKAVYSVISNDYLNLEIGLNARSFQPDLRIVLRIFDESMAQKIKENLDINLTLSMSAVADEKFFEVLTAH
jgi:voltage-gated potassium channel Kch